MKLAQLFYKILADLSSAYDNKTIDKLFRVDFIIKWNRVSNNSYISNGLSQYLLKPVFIIWSI